MSTTMVQMNTRIDADLKRRGDEALERAGFTPSQAVRALWEYAANHAFEPQTIRRALESEEDALARERQEIEGHKAYEEGISLVKKFEEKTGVALSFDYEMDDQELLEQALYERFIEGKRVDEV